MQVFLFVLLFSVAVWDSMMAGHAMMKTTKKPRSSTTTAKPNSYDDQSFGEDFSYAGEASAKIETSYRVPPPKGFVYHTPVPRRNILTDTPQYKYPLNANKKTLSLPQAGSFEIISVRKVYSNSPLDGPMVVKVHPDGTPVKEAKIHVEDEDLKQYKLSQVRIPAL